MRKLLAVIFSISKGLSAVSAVVLGAMVLLTVADVILRTTRRPILGTYEIVGLLGAIVIGFSIPLTSCLNSHIRVDFLILKLPSAARNIFNIATRCIGIGLFLVIGWNLVLLGMDLRKASEVTPTRHIPYYPILYGIGACCFFQCLVLFCDIVKVCKGEYE
jgi:TRAP-type C4-dicarboxylate transport system permease small subunit